MSQPNNEDTLALLTRLSQKPGVQSTLILSRETGAIVRTSGLISESSSANANSTLPASQDGPTEAFTNGSTDMNTQGTDGYANGTRRGGMQKAEEVARLVWSFVGAAATMTEGLDQDDEVKLLRVRTKKNELVIVPDAKYLLVVIHDTPPA